MKNPWATKQNMQQKKKVLVLYNYFYPGFKAGGPVQSLVNLVAILGHYYDFSVLTTAFDLNEQEPYPAILVNEWNDLAIGSNNIKVWYAAERVGFRKLLDLVQQVKPSVIYINGMYSWEFFLQPLLVKKLSSVKNIQYIISPRGMLQPGALAVKPFKKKAYLKSLQLSGLLNHIVWHATTKDEAGDIGNYIGTKAGIVVAGNIPKVPVMEIHCSGKKENRLKLVYLSLITEKKNLLLLVEALKGCTTEIVLDIFGPVKDTGYWGQCLAAMKNMPATVKVSYKGDVQPGQVQKVLAGYDAMILLTKGENFGHSLFESLSVGRPVITSHFTPWNNLENNKAGWNIDTGNANIVAKQIDGIAAMGMDEWKLFCDGAYQLAQQYFIDQEFEKNYQELFG